MGIAIENDNVSKLLLNRKCFNYFVQFYPLNTMTYKPIPEEVIRRAEQIAAKFKAKIYLPWDPSVSQPINPRFKIIHQFCTSNFLICNNMEAAAEIIKSRVPVMIVTTEGDSFDPSGEGFGGFRGDKVSIPYKWFKYQELVEEKKKEESNLGQDGQHQTKAQMMEELKKLQEEKTWLEQEKDAFARKAERLERVREQIQNFKGKLVFDSSSKYASQLPIFEEREKQEREDIERLKKEIENNDNMLKEIRKGSDVKAMFLINLKKLSEEEEKIAKEKEKAQKQLAESTTTIDNEKKEIEETKTRIKDTEKGIDLLTNVLEERSKYLASQQAKIEEMEREYEDLQQKVKEKQEKDEEAKQKAKEFGEKVSSASDQIDRLNEQIKKLKEDMNQARENFKDDPSLEHAPFQTDEQLEKIEVKKFDKEFKEIKERFYNLDKQINKEAESMGNRLEEQMQDLANKENILKQDKEQIYTNLEHLDEKSQQSVLQCFEFVNK